MSGRLRLLGAVVTLPWLLFYGISGSWVLARGLTASGAGQQHLDVGYSTTATPAAAMLVGVLIMAAFAIVMAAAVLLLLDEPRRGPWLALAAVALVWTLGAVWAAARGGLEPVLWAIFFFGLVYAAVLALLMVWRTGRAARVVSATDGGPAATSDAAEPAEPTPPAEPGTPDPPAEAVD